MMENSMAHTFEVTKLFYTVTVLDKQLCDIQEVIQYKLSAKETPGSQEAVDRFLGVFLDCKLSGIKSPAKILSPAMQASMLYNCTFYLEYK